jgi:RNA recognition motif-containing protein
MATTSTTPVKVPRVFFGNLPQYSGDDSFVVAKTNIVELCRPYGQITDVVVHPGKGTAFVTFKDMESAEYAIYRLHRTTYSEII